MKLRNLIIDVMLLLSAAILSAQSAPKEPRLDSHDTILEECMLNIGLFPKGFYWLDTEGNMWYIVGNPIKRVECNGNSGPSLCYTILLCQFQVAEVQASVDQGPSTNTHHKTR